MSYCLILSVPILHMRWYINDLGSEEKAEGAWKEQKGSHLFQASARAACQTYPTVSSGCAMPSKHNSRLGRQRRKVRQIHARSKVTLLNCELLNHGRMSRWGQRVLPPEAYGFNKCQLPSFFEGSNMMHSYLWGASNNHHWFRWDELFWIGKTHYICLLSREKRTQYTPEKFTKIVVFSRFLFWPMTSSWHHVLFHVLPPNTGYNRTKAWPSPFDQGIVWPSVLLFAILPKGDSTLPYVVIWSTLLLGF